MLTCLTIMFIAALAASPITRAAPVPFTTIARGADSQVEESRQAVVRTAEEWSKLWSQHGGAPSRPAVDFDSSMVLAVFAGTRPSAGYGVEIIGIEEQKGELVVTWRETGPAPGQMVAQMLTTPFHIVRTARHAGAVRFSRVAR
jgi:hypothetical protein